MKLEGLIPYHFNNFNLNTLVIDSESLKKNPLGDTSIRHNFVMSPKKIDSSTPVIFYLSGFSSDGWKNFSFNRFETNTVQDIDQWTTKGVIKPALYVFVNAWTKWGGSQFINSHGFGNYEDYIVKELVTEIKKEYPEVSKSEWTVFGGSSGGYGALHLGTKHPESFQNIVALAPDSAFNISLLPEIYKFLPYLKEVGGVKAFGEKLNQGLIKYPGDIYFGLMNFVAMTACYAPLKASGAAFDFEFPISETGELNSRVWQEWIKHDPVEFIPFRKTNVEKLKVINIYTGNKDEHGLQYGSRRLEEILRGMRANISYTELAGTHRSLGSFREQALVDLIGS